MLFRSSGSGQFYVSYDGTVYIGYTSGPANIQLTGSTGAATFAGKITTTNTVKCRDVNSDNGGFYFASTSIIPTQADGNYASTGLSLGQSGNKFNNLFLAGDVTAGAATFGGITTIGSTSYANYGLLVYNDKSNQCTILAQNNTDAGNVWEGYKVNAAATSIISATGNATFASSLNVGAGIELGTGGGAIGNISLKTDGTSFYTGDSVWRANSMAAAAVTIGVAGAATFGGTIQSGGNPNDGLEAGTKITSTGVVQATRADGSGSSKVWMGYLQDGNNPHLAVDPTSTITAAGAATFAGDINASYYVTDPNYSTNSGKAYLGGNDANGLRIKNKAATIDMAVIGWDGAATFAGSITASNDITSKSPDGNHKIGLRSADNGRTYLLNTTSSDIYIRPGDTDSAVFYTDLSTEFRGSITGEGVKSNTWMGADYVNMTGGNAAGGLFYGYSDAAGTIEVIRFDNDGSARFSGTVDIGTVNTAGVIQFPAATNWGPMIKQSASSINALGFFTDNTERLTIDNAGAATFGAASNATNNNGLAVNGNNGSLNIYTTRYSTDCFQVVNTSGSGTNVSVKFQGDGTAIFAGNITAANVSDIRFKENITDANPQLADVVALGSQLKNWDWKDDAPLNEELRARRFLGIVAQEGEKVCPGITYDVKRTKQGSELTPAVTELKDDDGNITREAKDATYEELDDSYKAINHDILVMKLLGAVAELTAKVAALEAA